MHAGARVGTNPFYKDLTCSADGSSSEPGDQQAEGAPAIETLLAVLDIQSAVLVLYDIALEWW